MNKNFYISLIFIFFTTFFSCEEIEEEKCVDAKAEMLVAIANFTQNESSENCNALKLVAQEYVSNECTDTTGFGELEPNFIADSLDCDFITCELPLTRMIQYSTIMEMSTELDSLEYCAYFDSTIMVMETIVANGCEIDGAPSITQAELDSTKDAGCDWWQDIILFSATFHEEFDPSIKSFVFVTDDNGSVLADTGFYNTGDDSFKLKKSYPKDAIMPEKIGITTLTYLPGENEYSATSNLGIDIGSHFHFFNPYLDIEAIGTSSYSFLNIPSSYYKIILSSKGTYTRLETSSESEEYNLTHYYDNEDVLVMLYFDDGTAGFLVVENVQAGTSNIVDLSNLQPAQQAEIINSTGLNPDYLSAYAYADGTSYISTNRYGRLVPGYGLDRMWNESNNFIINYPSSNTTPNFLVNAYVGSQWETPGGKNFRQTTSGSLPSSIEKIDADMTLISDDLGSFEINHSGSFDQWRVSLQDTSIKAFWSVFNSSSASTMILPSIPTSVLDEYPLLSGTNYSLNSIDLTDWMCADSYEEWVKLYHSTNGYYLDFCSGFRVLKYWPPE